MGKKVELKKAKTKAETSKRLEDEKKKKVFVKNIDPSMTKAMFKEYFIKYGPIEFVKIVREKKKNGKENNYAFVMFKKNHSLKNLLKDGDLHTVGGFEVECLELLTRDELKKKNIEEQ